MRSRPLSLLLYIAILISLFAVYSTSYVQASNILGSVDMVTMGAIAGWAYDADVGVEPVYVHIYVDDEYIDEVLANGYRPEVPNVIPQVQGAYHGYEYSLPGLAPGTHSVKAFVVDEPSGSEVPLPIADSCVPYITVEMGTASLDNGIVQVGVNLDWGGAIWEIIYQGRNLVNKHDDGRLVQVAVADGKDVSTYGLDFMSSGWGYNPTQGGDKYGHYSSVLTWNASQGCIYTKTCPLEWNPDDKGGSSTQGIPSDVYIEQWVRLDGQCVIVDYRLTHLGTDVHNIISQSIPTASLNADLDRLITYEGNLPWFGDEVTEKFVPAFPQSLLSFRPTEYWASLVDNNDFGLTLYTKPHCAYWAAGRFPQCGTNILTPLVQCDIPPSTTIETTAYLIPGPYSDARDIVYSLGGREDVTTVWEFNEDGDRQNWVPQNELSTLTVSDGILETTSHGGDPQMYHWPALNVAANEYPIIEIRMKASAGSLATVYFTTIADESWNQNKAKVFSLAPGIDYFTYSLDMRAVESWSGTISQIRLDPTDAQAQIAIDYIRIKAAVSPTIAALTPEKGPSGEAMIVTVVGTNFAGTTGVSFGLGITVNSFTVAGDTQITANITISPIATPGPRDVSVTSPGGTATLSNGFTVTQPPPSLSSASPNQGIQGQTLSVTIAGAHFAGVTLVGFGSEITINSFSMASDTQITASISISESAAVGTRDVSVTTGSGVVTLTGGFEVKQKSTPDGDGTSDHDRAGGLPVWIWIAVGAGAAAVAGTVILTYFLRRRPRAQD